MTKGYKFKPKYSDIEYFREHGKWPGDGGLPMWVKERCEPYIDIPTLTLCAATQEIGELREHLGRLVDAELRWKSLSGELFEGAQQFGLTVPGPEQGGELGARLLSAYLGGILRAQEERDRERSATVKYLEQQAREARDVGWRSPPGDRIAATKWGERAWALTEAAQCIRAGDHFEEEK